MVKISLLVGLVLRRVVTLRSCRQNLIGLVLHRKYLLHYNSCPTLALTSPPESSPCSVALPPDPLQWIQARCFFPLSTIIHSLSALSAPMFGDNRVRTHQWILEFCLPKRAANSPKDHTLRNLVDVLAYACLLTGLPNECQRGELKKTRHNHPN